jgi:myo-inositol 2-dehydrogenase/D-chiro-inositol 1-dehydrogenase
MFNLAIFGAGRIGQIHARNAAALPELSLKYVVDPNHSAAEALALQTAAKVVDIDAVFGDDSISGVIIASATGAHLDQALRAAAAGKKIFCEKPLDLDLDRARKAAPQLSRATMLVGFNRRFDPHFATLKSRIDSNAIGKLESLNIVSHDPAPPAEVFAGASCLVDPAIAQAGDVDTARTLLRTASGQLCVISNTRRSGYGYDQRIEAYGSAGTARVDNVLMSTVSTCTERGSAGDALQNFFLDRYAEAYRREMRHFQDILSGAATPSVGYHDGVASLVLAEAAALSVKRNAPVRVSEI